GPGPGVHGGAVVAQGTIDDVLGNPHSLTGAYLRGQRKIDLPRRRRIRPLATQNTERTENEGHTPTSVSSAPSVAELKRLRIVGARENNLKNLDVEIPLGVFICVTGASGSGKSSLINEILFKKLYSVFHDSRVLYGKHDRIEGLEQITDVINIDQSPIGRTPRSNPATY